MTLAASAHDPALPGLELAVDAEAMGEVFRRELPFLAATGWELRECTISRLHYHRGERCMLRYTLALVDTPTGDERRQWVTGLIQAGDGVERTWRKLSGAAQEEAALLSEPRMLVQVFPFDRRLPSLARLAAPGDPELEAALGPELGPIETWEVEPVQYRPGRVAVLRHTVRGRPVIPARFYIKVYRDDEDGARAHRIVRALWERAEARGVAVARPVAYLNGLRALVLGEVTGKSLRDRVARGEDIAVARTAARGLAAAQRVPVPELPRRGVSQEVVILERAARVLGWPCPELGRAAGAVAREVASRLGDAPSSPTHRELRTDHVLLDRDRIGVVDTDSYALADPLLDPARLLADLAGLALTEGDDRWEAAAGAFAGEYLRHLPSDSSHRLLAHYAGALLKEAVDLLQHQDLSWPEHVEALVEEARNALSGRAAWVG